MTDRIVIADAGPLIAFGRIKRLSLLEKTLGKLIAPLRVFRECVHDARLPGAIEILEAVNAKIIEVNQSDVDVKQYQHLIGSLGAGEASAIVLASQLNARLLIDEKFGRQTAKKMNLRIIGTGGVLVKAKELNLIKNVAPLLDELKGAGYYLSKELTKTILTIAKEKE